jgi:hypothetical protein
MKSDTHGPGRAAAFKQKDLFGIICKQLPHDADRIEGKERSVLPERTNTLVPKKSSRKVSCSLVFNTARAAPSIIAPRTHTDRQDAENGRCNVSNLPSRLKTSSPLMPSSTANFIRADTN